MDQIAAHTCICGREQWFKYFGDDLPKGAVMMCQSMSHVSPDERQMMPDDDAAIDQFVCFLLFDYSEEERKIIKEMAKRLF